jgi:proteic killer suppression protein
MHPLGRAFSGGSEIQIRFRDKDLELAYTTERLGKKRWHANARMVSRRMKQLEAAENLSALDNGPGGLHELKGDRAGQLALRLWGGYRLTFIANHNPVPVKGDGGLDHTRVTAVEILSVEDYHG